MHILNVADTKSDRLPVSADVVHEITWELSEVAFHMELCELDHKLISETSNAAWAERHRLLSIVFLDTHWPRLELPLHPQEDSSLKTLTLHSSSGRPLSTARRLWHSGS